MANITIGFFVALFSWDVKPSFSIHLISSKCETLLFRCVNGAHFSSKKIYFWKQLGLCGWFLFFFFSVLDMQRLLLIAAFFSRFERWEKGRGIFFRIFDRIVIGSPNWNNWRWSLLVSLLCAFVNYNNITFLNIVVHLCGHSMVTFSFSLAYSKLYWRSKWLADTIL